jgi:hypothetical protein
MADDNNPFDDPDVVQAASDGVNNQQQQQQAPPSYGDAYDDDDNNNSANIDMQQINKYIPPDAQKEIAVAAGSAVADQAINNAKDDYNKSSQTQSNQHEAPPPPSFCINLFNWFPLRLFCFIGGVLLVLGPILDLIFADTNAIQFFIYVYAICFGIITMFVESPTWKCTRKPQLKFFFWFRLLSRMWGRAWFYIFISVLCYAGSSSEGDKPIFTITAGAYCTLIGILSFFFSRLAAKKYVRIYTYIAAGTEGDELIGKFMRKFDELDLTQDATIGSVEITKIAEQAGRVLSNSERHAIQTFLDESCNGHVSKEDWMKMWMTYNTKQHFL